MYSERRAARTYNETYNEEVQRVLLAMLLRDREAFALCRPILDDAYFDDCLRPAVRYVLDYADRERDLPPAEMIRAKTGVEVLAMAEDRLHTGALAKEIEGFAQYKAMELAVLDGVELLQTGRAAEIVERAKAAVTISLMREIGTDYYADPEARLRRMLDKSGYVPTGWADLDRKLYGGFTRGGLNIFAGNSGSGKSLFLQNLAVNWSMMGFVVLYISLELSEDLISVRLDAMITERGTKEVLRDTAETAMLIRHKQAAFKPGRIYVKRLPEGGTNALALLAYVKEFQIRTGLKPDALLVDYLDLMYSNNKRIDPSDQFIKDKYVSEELRGLMHEIDMFGATASQLNRGAVDADKYDHSHIAGGISKVNTADNMFGINARAKERGLFDLQLLKTRSSSAVGQTIQLGYNCDTMRITNHANDNADAVTSKPELVKALAKAKAGPAPKPLPTPAVAADDGQSALNRLRQKAGFF